MNRKRSNNIKGHPCALCSCPVDKKVLAHNDVLFLTCISFLMFSDPALFLFTDHLYYFLTPVVPFSPDWSLFYTSHILLQALLLFLSSHTDPAVYLPLLPLHIPLLSQVFGPTHRWNPEDLILKPWMKKRRIRRIDRSAFGLC